MNYWFIELSSAVINLKLYCTCLIKERRDETIYIKNEILFGINVFITSSVYTLEHSQRLWAKHCDIFMIGGEIKWNALSLDVQNLCKTIYTNIAEMWRYNDNSNKLKAFSSHTTVSLCYAYTNTYIHRRSSSSSKATTLLYLKKLALCMTVYSGSIICIIEMLFLLFFFVFFICAYIN